MTEPIHIGSVTPILRMFDIDKTKDFYLTYLGFSLLWEHRFEPSFPLYMEVSLSKCSLHLSEHHGDCSPGAAVRIEINDIRAYHAQLHNKVYRYASPGIEETPWQTLEMKISDPAGNRIIFYQSIDPS